MHLLAATATSAPAPIPPRASGQPGRLLATFTTDDGASVEVWGPETFLALRYLQPGQRVFLARDSHDKYHLIEDLAPEYRSDPMLGDRAQRVRLGRLIRQHCDIYAFAHLNVSLRMAHRMTPEEVAISSGQIVAHSLNWLHDATL